MRGWRKALNNDIYVYNDEENNDPYYDTLNLTDNLSPLTTHLLDLFTECIKDKNFFISFPNEILGPKLLMAYTYVDLFKKSVLIITGSDQSTSLENSNKTLNNKYHLLYNKFSHANNFLFHYIQIGEYKKKKGSYELVSNFHLPRASRTVISDVKKELGAKFKLNMPKIVLNYSDKFKKIEEVFSQIGIYSEDNSIGCIIIENADRFLFSRSADNFIKLLKNCPSNIRIVLHFSNPDNRYIEHIKNELNSMVFSVNGSLLGGNSFLQDKSLSYFKNFEQDPRFLMIDWYNIDSSHFYEETTSIEIWSDYLNSEGMDDLRKGVSSSAKLIDYKKLKYKDYFRMAKKLPFTLLNLAINPSFFTFGYNVFDGWTTRDVESFLNTYEKMVKSGEKEEQKDYLLYFIDAVASFYFRLANTKIFGQLSSYSAKGKDYVLLDILNNKDSYFGKDSQIVVGTFNKTEPNIIKNIIAENNLFSLEDIEIEGINLLKKRVRDKDKKILILPGLVYNNKCISQFNEPYKKIIILAYEGLNKESIEKNVKRIKNYDIQHEGNSIDYLHEIYDYLEISTEGTLIEDYHKRLVDEKEDIAEEITEIEDDDQDILDGQDSNPDFEINNDDNSIRFVLRSIATDETFIRDLPRNKSFFKFDSDDVSEGVESSPDLIKKGEYVLLVDNDVQKSLLDLVLEVNKISFSNDLKLEYWKEKLLEFITQNKLKITEFSNLYHNNGGKKREQTVGNWCRGNVIGPRDAEDLWVIGKVIKDEYIQKNYEKIMRDIRNVRSYHRATGRKLRNLIIKVISNEHISDLNEVDTIIYENIKDSIYEVIEKEKKEGLMEDD